MLPLPLLVPAHQKKRENTLFDIHRSPARRSHIRYILFLEGRNFYINERLVMSYVMLCYVMLRYIMLLLSYVSAYLTVFILHILILWVHS